MRKLLLIVFVIALYSCGTEEPGIGGGVDDFDRGAMLTNWADNIIIPAYSAYNQEVATLNNSALAFTEEPNAANLSTLRNAWLGAYKSWQTVSMFEIGKAESISLRNFTNIYPTNIELIEQNIILGEYNLELPTTFNQQGFPALDYILYGLADNDQQLIEFFLEEQAENPYAKYLLDLTGRLKTLAEEVLNDWNSGFRDSFILNDGSAATSSVNKIVNDYVSYYETFLRKGKVGFPAGVFTSSPKTHTVEALYKKDVSRTLMLEALNAVQSFFNGSEYNGDRRGESLASYLEYLNGIKGGDDLSMLINNQFDVSRQVGSALNENFVLQVETNNDLMLETYNELQKNVVLMKVDMMQALNIRVDYVDADGD